MERCSRNTIIIIVIHWSDEFHICFNRFDQYLEKETQLWRFCFCKKIFFFIKNSAGKGRFSHRFGALEEDTFPLVRQGS